MKIQIQKLFINSYRVAAFIALSAILAIAVGYLGILLFYSMSTSWAAPFKLSPTQEKVLAMQPQVASLQNAISKQKIEIESSNSKVKLMQDKKDLYTAYIEKIEKAKKRQTAALASDSRQLYSIANAATGGASEFNKFNKDIEAMAGSIDAELNAGIITKDVATTRKMAIMSVKKSSTDSLIASTQLKIQASNLARESRTLDGDTSSMQALSMIDQLDQLKASVAQLDIDMIAQKENVALLTTEISGSEKILTSLKNSPYYKALSEDSYVVFVPYENSSDIKEGDTVYSCYFQIIGCRDAGKITKEYSSEETFMHPLFKSMVKGKFYGVEFKNPKYSHGSVVFIGSKPFLI